MKIHPLIVFLLSVAPMHGADQPPFPRPPVRPPAFQRPSPKSKFLATTRAHQLAPERSDEIIGLAVELEEAFAAGLSLWSAEAQLYGEAMRVLLDAEDR